jgi:hypothetical protein
LLAALSLGAVSSSLVATGASAQRRVTPPPRWVSDNTLWPLQYVPYVGTAGARSMSLECAPFPAASPRLLRCTTRTQSLRVERMAEPYAALLASTQPGELERELEARKRRECGPEARPYERVPPSWSDARRQGLERYNASLRALRGHLCQPCSGAVCRDIVQAIVAELDVSTCTFDTAEDVLDMTPTGAMRWGSETLDPTCGGRLVHSVHAQGRDWVYTRTRQFDEDAPRSASAPASCAETESLTMRTGMPLYADPGVCTVLVL